MSSLIDRKTKIDSGYVSTNVLKEDSSDRTIALPLDRFTCDDEEKEELLKTFRIKAASRNVEICKARLLARR